MTSNSMFHVMKDQDVLKYVYVFYLLYALSVKVGEPVGMKEESW